MIPKIFEKGKFPLSRGNLVEHPLSDSDLVEGSVIAVGTIARAWRLHRLHQLDGILSKMHGRKQAHFSSGPDRA